MVARIVLFLGFLLLVASAGTAGWQYWQSLPVAQATPAVADEAYSAAPKLVEAPPAKPADGAAPLAQTWMISSAGGLVTRKSTRNFLEQHRFEESRVVRFRFPAPMTALLAPGEVLPAPVFHAALAETRALAVAARLCEPLLNAWAEGCAIASAELAKDSYDPATQTAYFDVTLAYTLKPDPVPLPDLATRSFVTEPLYLNETDLALATETPRDLLLSAVQAASNACSVMHANGQNCRVMEADLFWESPGKATASIRIGALTALPKGIFPAPPL